MAHADEYRRTTHDDDDDIIALEDRSCYDVNRAYDRMNNSGRWSTTTFYIYPNNIRKMASHVIYFDGRRFRQNNGDWWLNRDRPMRRTIDDQTGKPIFSDCRFLGNQTIMGEPALYYQARWQKDGSTASIEIWISKTSQKFIQNILHYRLRPAWFEVSNVFQTMDYDRSHAIEPWNLPGH